MLLCPGINIFCSSTNSDCHFFLENKKTSELYISEAFCVGPDGLEPPTL